MDAVLLAGLFAAGIRLAMSIGLAALGEVVAQRSGMINVGIEGIMLVGAFLAAWGALLTGSPGVVLPWHSREGCFWAAFRRGSPWCCAPTRSSRASHSLFWVWVCRVFCFG